MAVLNDVLDAARNLPTITFILGLVGLFLLVSEALITSLVLLILIAMSSGLFIQLSAVHYRPYLDLSYPDGQICTLESNCSLGARHVMCIPSTKNMVRRNPHEGKYWQY